MSCFAALAALVTIGTEIGLLYWCWYTYLYNSDRL